MSAKILTPENVNTRGEIAALLYEHNKDNFHLFTAFAERMLDKYASIVLDRPRMSGAFHPDNIKL